MKAKPNITFEDINKPNVKLSDVIEAKELFEAYPELKDIRVFGSTFTELNGARASYFPELKAIAITENAMINRETAFVHEIQHVIQDIEGFARGTNINKASELSDSDIQEILSVKKLIQESQKLKNSTDEKDRIYNPLPLEKIIESDEKYPQRIKNWAKNVVKGGEESISEFFNNTPEELYLRNAGEAEARNAQFRMNMTPEERRASLAVETEDVAREDQIFIENAFNEAQAYLDDRYDNPKLSEQKNVFTPITRQQLDALTKPMIEKGILDEVVTDKTEYNKALKEAKERKGLTFSNGDTYGFVQGRKMYIDTDKLNSNTPIHEGGHLYWPMMPEAMRAEITELLKKTDGWKTLTDEPAYTNLKTDDQKANELFNRMLGNYGENAQKTQEIIGKDVTLFARIRNAMNEFLNWLKAKFGNTDAKLNEFAKRTLGELLNGKKIEANLENTEKNANFVQLHNINSDGRTKTGMDYGRTMESGSLRKLVGSEPQGRRIEQALEAGNRSGSGSSSEGNERKTWNKGRFLGTLEVTAKENGTWIDNIKSIADKAIGKGFENETYVADDGKHVIKVNNFAFLNDDHTQYEYTRDFDYFVDRLNAHNTLFPKDRYRIIGFSENSLGEVSMVLQQPYVRNAEYAPMELVEKWMYDNGFKKGILSDGLEGYSNGRYELSDVKPQNVLVDTNGDLRFIDLDIRPIKNNSSESVVSEPAINTQLNWTHDTNVVSNLPEGEGLPTQTDEGKTYSERVLSEHQQINFIGQLTGTTKIESSQDVAFLFKNLESAASENAFAVLHGKDGSYKVLYLSTGTTTSTAVDLKILAAAIKEMGAESITFVHNHPSGTLRPSIQDRSVHQSMNTLLDIPVNPSVIIDTDSGKYGVFDTKTNDFHTKISPERPVKDVVIHQFDRIKLYQDSNTRIKLSQSIDIAKFISQHHRGSIDKLQLIITDNQLKVNAYILIENGLSQNELQSRILELVGKHGENAILVSNSNMNYLNLPVLQMNLNKAGIKLIDALTVKQNNGIIDNYISAADEGLLFEPTVEYQNRVEDSIEDNRKQLDAKINNLAFRLREAYEDRVFAVKEFFDLLRKEGTEIKDYNDFYLQATHLQGKNDAQLKQYNEFFQKPLNDSINGLLKKGFNDRDIENYVILKHGLERNAYMRQKDISKGITPKTDYAGVMTVEKEIGSPAQQFIDNFEQKAGKTAIDDFWKKINSATEFSLRKLLEGGLIGKDIYSELISRYKYYVPLRGHDATTAEDLWKYIPDKGNVFSDPIKKAEGRKSRAETPFAFIAQMAQSAIISSNKNILNQTILRLARKDTTGMMSVSKTWYVNGVPQEADYSENPETYIKNQEEFEKRMLDLEAKGIASQKRGKLDLGDMFIAPAHAKQHAVRISQNGQEYTVYINANPAVSQAINGLNLVDANSKLSKNISYLTRGLAQTFTSKNPLFWTTNFARDYQYATAMLLLKEDAKYMIKFQGNLAKSSAALNRHFFGKSDLTNKSDRYLAEFIMNGGKTGFSHLLELNKIQEQVERDIKRGNKKNMWNNLVDTVENTNDLIENMTRFSVFITSRESGRSVVRSISDAKEVTVNFNKMGSGAMGARYLRTLYLFVNAGIQGLSNILRAAAEHPGKATVLFLFYSFTGSVLMPLLASMIGGEDEYWKLSDYDRQNFFCFYIGKGFIKIPIPQELRVFHGFGDNMAQWMLGKKDVGNAFLDAMGNFADLIPSDPFGSATAALSDWIKPGGKWFGTLAATTSPDIIKPWMQYSANRNFMGGQIFKENQPNYKPGYKKVRTNKKGEAFAPLWLVEFAKATDNFTGGDGTVHGWINIHPDVMQHIVRGYTGGIYDIFSSGIEMIYKKTNGKNIEIKDTPIKRFFTSTSDTDKMNQGLNAKYYKIADDVKENISKINAYEKSASKGEIGILNYSNKLQELNADKYYILNANITLINDLNKILPELDEENQRKVENDIIKLKEDVIELSKEK